MEFSYYGKTPPVSDITVYTIIAGDEPRTEGNEKILLFPQNAQDEALSLGNLRVCIKSKTLKGFQASIRLGNFVQPLISQVVIPLAMYSLEKKLSASAITIDPSEMAFLLVPSGGARGQRAFHLKIACVIPIAFLPFPLGFSLNSADELHWVKMSKILDGYRLDGGEDEEYLTKIALRAYLSG